MTRDIRVVLANYRDPQHAKALVGLLNAYALDPMGGGEPLGAAVRDNLVESLAKLPHAFSVLAYVDDVPAALANCFEAFSTFKCQPIVNIHDVVVLATYRGLGLSQRLLEFVELTARAKGCCKLTLEVLEGNHVARSAYKKQGFSGYELNEEHGNALFWQKWLR